MVESGSDRGGARRSAVTLWNGLGPGPLDVFIGAIRVRTGLPLGPTVWLVVGSMVAIHLLAAAASDRSGRPEPRARMVIELSWLVAGVALGGPVGLGTILLALTIGPSVAVGHRLVHGAVAQTSERSHAFAASASPA